MKIFVISLEDASKRRQFMTDQLQSLGVFFSFFSAIDGRKLSDAEKEKHCDYKWMRRYIGRILTPGEIGCSLSHIGIYRKIVDENIPYALIFEDDTWITPSLIPLMQLMEKKKIFDGGGIFILQDNACGHWNKKNGKCIVLSDMYRFDEMDCACWTHAYIITKQAAEQLLKYIYPVTHAADCWGWIIHHKMTKVYGLNFTLTTQNNYCLSSTIGSERFIQRRSSWKKILRLFWRFFWIEFDRFVPLAWYR